MMLPPKIRQLLEWKSKKTNGALPVTDPETRSVFTFFCVKHGGFLAAREASDAVREKTRSS